MQSLAAEFWDLYLEQHPLDATMLGYRRHDGRLPDVTAQGRRAARRRLQRLKERLARMQTDDLSPADRLTGCAQRRSYRRSIQN